MLSQARILLSGTTVHAHEREGLSFVEQNLPDRDPFHVWELFELIDPTSGRLYEIDLLVMGYAALYLVELKGGPGKYAGNANDWSRAEPGQPSRYMDPPLSLTNHKSKVLKSRLAHKLGERRIPWIQALVFLSAEGVELDLTAEGRVGVVTRRDVIRALTHHEFPGSERERALRPIDRPTARDVVRAIGELGIRPRKGRAYVGPYELGEVLEDGTAYQDRVAQHRDRTSIRRRARIYLVPQQTSVERRQALLRAADREAQLLYELREHPGILRFADYVTDAPLGPTVLFDELPDALPLDAFMRQNPDLPSAERISLIAQIGRALAFCHKKQIVHGALSPESVLVRRRPDSGELETRVYNFQLGAGADLSATVHVSLLATKSFSAYQAPELREDPSRRSPVSDMFSLGAVAYFVLTGKAPAESGADLDERLAVERSLNPRTVNDGIHSAAAEAVDIATQLSPVNRADDVESWVEILITETQHDGAREPDAVVDPLTAQPGDMLGDLMVEAALGQGATARVLKVLWEKDNRSYALKVSLGPEHDARLAAEARALLRLRSSRIVEHVETRVLSERTALLLSLAGDRTLYRDLADQGPVSLDFASRYGDDLLSALVELEDKQIQHRDIKPANLGVGTATKGAYRLVLFDFSLAEASASDLGIGTTAYRDPFLRSRGAWDAAADRWSAAVTLHEMLAGMRPSFGERAALDPEAKLAIAAERFDASVRTGLSQFFERALHRDAELRFASANEMLHAWARCFEAPALPVTPPTVESGRPEPELEQLSDDRIALITPDTPIDSLPLSARAKNALDRAGATCAQDLLSLPDNRLSAVRGVGRGVAREILALRERWQALTAVQPLPAEPFFAGYQGDDLMVSMAGLDETASQALVNAGLRSLRALAQTPGTQIAQLARAPSLDESVLRALLEREHTLAGEREHPTTIEGFLEALMPRGKTQRRYFSALFGLSEPFLGRLDVTVRELADHFEKTPALFYIALMKQREVWSKQPAVTDLRERVRALLDGVGGALPLARAADLLVDALAHDREAAPELIRARAAGLLRVVAETEKAEPLGLRLSRLLDDQSWLVAREDLADVLRLLGERADELAARPVLASPAEVTRALVELTESTPLASLAPERLVDLAVSASRTAARSARFEIYPRGLPAERALELSAALLYVVQSAAFQRALTPELIQQRVSARYPEAQALPERPALDELLSRYGLIFDAESGSYHRPGERPNPTHTAALTKITSAVTGQPRAQDGRAATAQDFEDTVRALLERQALCVLGVTADVALDAARRLKQRVGLVPQSFDALLIAEMKQQIAKHRVDPEKVFETDRLGPGSPGWPNLLRLASSAADEVASRLFPPKEPLLLVQPGLIARYRLERFLARAIEASRDDDARAIFLLVPGRDTGTTPRINGELAIPGLLASQSTWIPREWLSNAHHAAA